MVWRTASISFHGFRSSSSYSIFMRVTIFLFFRACTIALVLLLLEAMSRGLPVVCLDLGGPKNTVTPNSGVIIKTAGLNTAQVASRIAAELTDLIASPTRLAALSAGAISRANEFLLPNRVAQFYREAWKFIEDRGGNSPPVATHSCAGMPMRRTSCNRCLT